MGYTFGIQTPDSNYVGFYENGSFYFNKASDGQNVFIGEVEAINNEFKVFILNNYLYYIVWKNFSKCR